MLTLLETGVESSDGKRTHPGACAPGSKNKHFTDFDNSGEEIKANGKVVGTFIFDSRRDLVRIYCGLGSTHTQVNYDFNGQVITEEKLNGNNIVQKSTYFRGDRVLVKKDKNASKDYYYLYNGHGGVVQIIDTSGAVVNSHAYDVWGNITSQKEETPNPFKYRGSV